MREGGGGAIGREMGEGQEGTEGRRGRCECDSESELVSLTFCARWRGYRRCWQRWDCGAKPWDHVAIISAAAALVCSDGRLLSLTPGVLERERRWKEGRVGREREGGRREKEGGEGWREGGATTHLTFVQCCTAEGNIRHRPSDTATK